MGKSCCTTIYRIIKGGDIMSEKDLVSEEVLQELINKLEEAKLKEEKDEEELIENILNK